MREYAARGRRFLAYLVDFLLFLPLSALSSFILQLPLPSGIFVFLAVFLVASLFTFFVLRDYLFKGSSIGKRIFKLAVVDARTFSEPSGKQLIVKGLFSLFLIPVDALFLIFSSRSLGERATDTRVMPLQLIPDEKPINPFNEKPRSSTQKRIVCLYGLQLVFHWNL